MNLKTLFAILFIAFASNFSFASFPVERAVSQQSNVQTTTKTELKTKEAKTLLTPVRSGEKSKGIALILALTLGLLAAHRWYLGTNTFINIIFIFTFGGLGIWLLIDIIRIITGDLNPSGRYKDSFF